MKKNRLFLSMLALGLLAAPAMADDTVTLTTGKAVGETVTLQVNQLKRGATVDWGDGTTVTYAQTEDDNLVISGELKGSTVSITSTSKLTTLICEGLELTALDVTNAPNLVSLYCQNNNLTSLDLSENGELQDLNCSDNQLNAITLSSAAQPKLTNLNVANNNMEKLGSSTTFSLGISTLQHLDLSNNAFKRLTLSSTNKNLDAVLCANNQISGQVSIASIDSLSVFVGSNNAITTLLCKTNMPALRQVFADNNSISSLNLSGAPVISYVAAENNELTRLQLPESGSLYALTCQNNELPVSSLPRRRNVTHITYAPQTVDEVTINSVLNSKTVNGTRYYYALVAPSTSAARTDDYLVDLTEWAYDANGSKSIDLTYMGKAAGSEEFTELARNTDIFLNTTTSYYGKVSFYKPFDEAYVILSSDDYPELVQNTSRFMVVNSPDDITAIDNVLANAGGLTIAPSKGTLRLSSNGRENVRVYSSKGEMLWNGQVDSTTTTIQLPAGVYIVNGQKVVL